MRSVKTVACALALLGLCFALAGSDGCGSSSGSSSPATSSTTTGTAVVNPLLVGAAISVTDANGTAVKFSGSTVTDASGNYTISMPSGTDMPCIVSFTGGHFAGTTDSFNGTLSTLVQYHSESLEIYATSLTTLAAELYTVLRNAGKTATTALSLADSYVRGFIEPFGSFNIFETPPVISNATSLTSIHTYRFANINFATMLAENIGADVFGSAQSRNSENLTKLIRAVAQDLSDEKWDGNTLSGVSAGTELASMQSLYGTGAAFAAAVAAKVPDTSWSSVGTILKNEEAYTGGSVYGLTPTTSRPGHVRLAYHTDTTLSSANTHDLANNHTSDGGGSSPVQLGEAWLQTAAQASVQVNPAPFFVDSASVTDNMKANGTLGTRMNRLHSWAGWFLWGNGNVKYKVNNSAGVQINTDYLTQGAIVADPMSAQFTPPALVKPVQTGFYEGLMLGMPLGQLYTWQYASGGYGLFPHSGQTTALTPGGPALPLLHVYPADTNEDTSPNWTPSQAFGDRMGDWDMDFLLANPSNSSENIKATMAQGSPFAWFTYEKPANGTMLVAHVAPPYPSATRTVAVTDHSNQTGVTNLGCVLVGVSDTYVLGDNALTTSGGTTIRYMAVFYDASTTKAQTVSAGATDASIQGVFLAPLTSGADYHFVTAGLPTAQYPATGGDAPTMAQALTAAKAWASALAPYAFNFVTDTDVTYSVQYNKGLVATTFTPTVSAKGPVGSSGTGKTAMCLKRHHYADFNDGQGDVVFNGGTTALNAASITPTAAGPFTAGALPSVNNGYYPYWTVLGKLKPVAVSSFSVNYVLTTPLPFMPLPEDNATNNGTSPYYLFNQMTGWNWSSVMANAPPAGTYIMNGPQGGGYSAFGRMRALSSSLAIAKKLADLPVSVKGVDNPAAVAPGSTVLNKGWSEMYADPPMAYNSTYAFDFYLQNLEKFISLSTNQTAYNGWANGGTSGAPQADSASYFRYVPNIGAVLYYPENVAIAPGGVGILAEIPLPMNMQGNPESAFQGDTGWTDWHYSYGYLLTAMAQSAWLAPFANATDTATFFAKERYGQFVDQIAMSVAYDPAVGEFWNATGQGLTYSKLNFFDQWSGQGWTNGLWAQAGQNSGINGFLGKEENSFGEAWNVWSGMALWGMATGRQQVADLGVYLATTALYNYQAYWADQMQSRIATSTATTNATEIHWSAKGDYVPVAAVNGTWGGEGADYHSTWFFWGTADGTTSTGPAAAWAMKMLQGQVIIQSEFGDAMPIGALYNQWFPISSTTLDFGREPARATGDDPFQQHLPGTLNKLSDKGWNTSLAPGLTNFVSTVNKMGALSGMSTVYANPKASTDSGQTPFNWFWGLVSHGDCNQTVWNDLVNAASATGVVDAPHGTVAEDLNFYWIVDKYGIPAHSLSRYFGYSADAAATPGMVQPATAAFYKGQGTEITFTAFNPNNATIHVNFWAVGNDATSTGGMLSTAMPVPAHWFNSTGVAFD